MKTHHLIFVPLLLLTSLKMVNAQSNERIKLFLNCSSWGCYTDYLRVELSFFDFVRDRLEADVEVLIINQENGAGGRSYTLEFIGRHHFEGKRDTIRFSTKKADTEEMVRNELLKNIQIGLLDYLKHTHWIKQVTFTMPKREMKEAVIQKDKWDYWVTTISVGGWGDWQSNSSSTSLNGRLKINRIKPELKIQNSFSYWVNYQKYVFSSVDDNGEVYSETIRAKNEFYGGNSFIVKSLTEHWSAGGYASISSSIRSNYKLKATLAPAIEYNIFPTSQNTQKQLRLISQVGYRGWQLIQPNNDDKTTEFEPYYRVDAILSLVKSWGNVYAEIGGHHFFNRKDSYNISLDISTNLRLFEGFSFNFYVSSSYIKDQDIYLPKRINQNDVLLGASILPTNFQINASVGFSYTFGSINNSVVNPRLEGVFW